MTGISGPTPEQDGRPTLPPPPAPLGPTPSRSDRPRALIVAGALVAAGLAAGAGVWASAGASDHPDEPTSNTTSTSTVTTLKPDTGPPVGAKVFDLNELVAGQCLNEPNFEDMELIVFSVSIVDCAEPHDVEITEVFDLTDEPGAAYPGDTAMYHEAVPRCEKTFEKYVGEDYYSSALEIGVYFPMEAGWEKYDDRRVVCYVLDPDFEQLTGSMAGTGR
jgi:hypothetical protein